MTNILFLQNPVKEVNPGMKEKSEKEVEAVTVMTENEIIQEKEKENEDIDLRVLIVADEEDTPIQRMVIDQENIEVTKNFLGGVNF